MSAVVTHPLPAGGLRARTRHTPPPQHSSTTSTLRRTDSQRLGEDRRGHRDPLSTTATITLSVRYTWDPAARWGGGACLARHSPCALLTRAPQASSTVVAVRLWPRWRRRQPDTSIDALIEAQRAALWRRRQRAPCNNTRHARKHTQALPPQRQSRPISSWIPLGCLQHWLIMSSRSNLNITHQNPLRYTSIFTSH
ncbi:hypothetical protein Pmani_005759 [Petrolisthes manimaculis]|uniref:Uncharacterized protein n=1 Tax=Petrolisthes manimaculis TaxID=1843537 RepID=A0AAE1QEB8_9EUCA|nr:hypothetical protein Pmani_005759 [Petrolisthes manimaculis]